MGNVGQASTDAPAISSSDQALDRRLLKVREAFEAWHRGTGSINDLMDDATVVVIPGISPHCGTFTKQEFLRDVAQPFMACFAERPVPLLQDLWCNERSVVATAQATGVVAGGAPYANSYVFIFEMTNGSTTRITEYLDMAAFEAVWNTKASVSDVG